MSNEINLYYLKPPTIRQKIKLKKFIASIFISEKKMFSSLTIIFCSDEYLLRINEKFLKHKYFTDIITFNLAPSATKKIEGEIYISIDRVRDNATTYLTSVETEMHRVIFHGVLHLCGYKDDTLLKKDQMTLKENFYLKQYRSISK